MASTYSSNLRLELIATGEKSGTWGDVTNTNLGTLLEEAIGGYVAVTVTDGADTVLTTNNGTADQARNMTLNLTGTLTAARNVIVPAIEKIYVVKNSTSGGFSVTVKVSGQTGVTIPNGATMLVFVDGTDVRQAGAAIGASNTIELGTLADTTISRSAAGVIAVEGGVVPKENRANTFSANQRVNANVGIGMDPSHPLDVTGLIRLSGALTLSSSTFAYSYDGGTLGQVRSGVQLDGANQIATIYTAQNERVRVDASGNVGIGGSPSYSLDIQQSNPRIRLNATTTTTNAYLMSTNAGGTAYLGLDNSVGGLSTAYALNVYHMGAYPIVFGTNGTERMRIDTSGNVGIGINSIPSNRRLMVYGSTSSTASTSLALTNSGTGAGASNGFTMELTNFDAYLWNYETGPIIFGTSNLARMRIASDGRVGIGTTPSAKLHVDGAADYDEVLRLNSTGSPYLSVHRSGTREFYLQTSSSGVSLNAENGKALLVYVGGSERMRIDTTGRVGFGGTGTDATVNAVGNPYCFSGYITGFEAVAYQGIYQYGSGTAYFGYWKYGSTVVGSITSTGSTTVYGTSSDYRLKENVCPINDAASRLMRLKPCSFVFKTEPNKISEGFLAHEAQEVVPGAVTGTKDGMRLEKEYDEKGNIIGEKEVPDYQAIDQSKLVPLLTAALQEALLQISELKTDIENIKMKIA